MDVNAGRRSRALGCALACLALAVPQTAAATVELLVLDEQGQEIAVRAIALRKADSGRFGFTSHSALTDAGGRVVLSDVADGRYDVFLTDRRGAFVTLENHPSNPQPSITVDNSEQTLQSTVRFARGVPVVFRVAADGAPLPRSRLHLHDLDREYRGVVDMSDRVEAEIRLIAGRWTATVTPVPGYLLTSVELNRDALPGDTVEFDLPTGDDTWHVNFEYAAPARIHGRMTFEGEDFGVQIVAQLQEAGDWLPAALSRGGSSFERVAAWPDSPRGDYEMVVPSGSWVVRPSGDGLETSEPEEVTIRLEPGDDRRIDFTVAGSDGDDRSSWIMVDVVDADGEPADRATVEAWPTDIENQGDFPLARAMSRGRFAILRGLGNRKCLYRLGKPGHLETESLNQPTEESGLRRLKLQLERGGTLHAVLHDEAERAATSVEVKLDRLDDGGSSMAAADVLDWATHPKGPTDGSGHAWLEGIYSGKYRISGEWLASDSDRFFVELRNKGDSTWSRHLDLEFQGEETVDIDIRLREAGGLRATLRCADGAALPDEVDLILLPVGLTYRRDDAAEWNRQASFAGRRLLAGRNRDTLQFGPIEFDSYHIVVRPQGFDRWTWAIGGELPGEAAALTIAPGKATDIGAIAIDCAPAIAVRPIASAGLELPDLVATGSFDPLATITGTVAVGEHQRPLAYAPQVREPTQIQFRELEEGYAELIVTIWNPYFLPTPDLTVKVSSGLHRGKTVVVEAPLAGIGGAIELTLPDHPSNPFPAVRATRIDENSGKATETHAPTIVTVQDRTALIPSLLPGLYNLVACRDLESVHRTVPLWNPVRVTPAVRSLPESTSP